jgi:ABC-type glycerol-3-phosphate transport system substrate-binding protein
MPRLDPVSWTYLLAVVLASALVIRSPVVSDKTADGRTIVTYWEKWTGREHEAIRRTVERFNESQDRIEVRVFSISQISDKAKVAIAGGNPPDLLGLFAFNVTGFAEEGALARLDAAPFSDDLDASVYEPNYLQLCRHDGRLWALPTTPATHALYYNTRIFREEAAPLRAAGLDPTRAPRSLDELWSYHETLTEIGEDGEIERIGYLPINPGYFHFEAYFGGRLFRDGEITLDDPGVLAALEWIDRWSRTGGRERLARFLTTLGQRGSADDPFFTGKVAMILQGVWLGQFIQANGPEGFEWSAAPFPVSDPSLGTVAVVDSDVIAIPAGARHPREAAEFLKFLATPAGIEPLCRDHFKASPLRSTSAEFYADHPHPRIDLFRDLGRRERGYRSPPIAIWQEYLKGYRRAYEDVQTGQRTPREALDALKARISRRWARVRAPAAARDGA